MKHVSDTKMGKADRLSRRPDWKVGIEKNNENQVFIEDCWLCNLSEVVIEEPEVEKIKKTRSKDEKVVRIVEGMKKTGKETLRGEEWQIKGELVLKKQKVYVLKNEELT